MANLKPIASAVQANGVEDTGPIAITLTGSDTDGTIASFRIGKLPMGGRLFLDPAMTIAATVNGNYSATGDALTLYFQPATNFSGAAIFQYSAIDNLGALSAKANATFNIAAVNDAPVAANVTARGVEDSVVQLTLQGTDVDGKVTAFRIDDLPANGILCRNKDGSGYISAGEVLTFGTKLYFKPSLNWNGTTDFHFRAIDSSGTPSQAAATASVTLTSVNDAPTLRNVRKTGETLATIPVTISGDDIDGTVNWFRIEKLPSTSAGLLYLDPALTVLVKAGQVYSASDEKLTVYFKPTPGFTGAANFQYSAIDDAGAKSVLKSTANIDVVFDMTPPAAPVITGYADDDNGTPGDGITHDRTLILTGTAEAHAVVEVFDRITSSLGTVVANSAGAWSLTTGALSQYPDFPHSFTATATDAGGHTSAPSVALTVTISPSTVFDLTFLSAAFGFIIQGAGSAVSWAGDVNGDGYGDLIVGSEGGAGGGMNAGEAYVIFGGASGFGRPVNTNGVERQVIDLSALSEAKGFIIQGDTAYDVAGTKVSTAGDINGDGFTDVIVGATRGDDGGVDAGEAYVIFGKSAGFGVTVNTAGFNRQVVDLTALSASDGFIIQGDASHDFAGRSVSSAGDVNGDGFADLIVGAVLGDDGGSDAGEAYMIFGKASGFGTTVTTDGYERQVIDLSALSIADGFIIQGDSTFDMAGASVASAGDINGDGFADFVVGAPSGGDGGTQAGEAYVIFGRATSFGATANVDGADKQVLDLTALSGADGFIIQGDNPGDFAGWSVSSAGDLNGDGFTDVIVGATRGDDGGVDAGEAYVIFGKATGFGTTVDSGGSSRQVLDLAALSPTDGFVIQGDRDFNLLGGSVSSAGDVNGDGFGDLIVGATGGGSAASGAAYVIFGKAAGFGTTVVADGFGRQVLDITTLLTSSSSADGFVIQGDSNAGDSVSSAGDLNGDGFSDLMVGAPNGSKTYVLFGSPFGGSSAPVTNLGTTAAEILIGGLGDDTLSGGGGVDVFHAGSGDDLLTVSDMTFRLVDGGSGTDTLRFVGAGAVFDFTSVSGERIEGIEALDITGSGDNTAILRAGDVLDMSDTPNADFTGATSHNALVLYGDAGDQLQLIGFDPNVAGGIVAAAWQLQASDVSLDGSAGGAFDVYDLVRGSLHLASVAVDSDVTVDISQTYAFLV